MDSPDAEILALGFNRRQGLRRCWHRPAGQLPAVGLRRSALADDRGRPPALPQLHPLHPSLRRQDAAGPPAVPATGTTRLPWASYHHGSRRRPEGVLPADVSRGTLGQVPGGPRGPGSPTTRRTWSWSTATGVYQVDEELKSLGIDSNRKVETLERLFDC